MSKIIKKPYDVVIAMSSKTIHDFKLMESEWPEVLEYVSGFLNLNVRNLKWAIKLIKDQLLEVEGDFYKKYSNKINNLPKFNKLYYNLSDWILQLSLKRVRLLRAKYKKTVAKNILTEELLLANKFFNEDTKVNNFHIEKIIEISILNFIK